jgi:hypothetical protein
MTFKKNYQNLYAVGDVAYNKGNNKIVIVTVSYMFVFASSIMT